MVCLLALTSFAGVKADSNISADAAFAWGANIGWTNWRPDSPHGAEMGEFVCAGFIYSANVGWINLGNGRPLSGVYYQNDSAGDFGVNHDQRGHLSGLAYGANIGWINFETNGAPRIDLRTGWLSGYVYGANIGWINLGDANLSLRADSIRGGADSDQDGIPDAWELIHAGNLTTLTATGDADHDGQSDLQEYWADTDPLDPGEHLRILSFSTKQFGAISDLMWNTRPTRRYRILTRPAFDIAAPWLSIGLDRQMGDGNPISATVTNRVGSAQGFFQIEVTRPLAP